MLKAKRKNVYTIPGIPLNQQELDELKIVMDESPGTTIANLIRNLIKSEFIRIKEQTDLKTRK
jgi:hypothetical protein